MSILIKDTTREEREQINAEYNLEKDFSLEDGTRKIFLNTKGINEDEVPAELVHLLPYVENSTDAYVNSVKDARIDRLHEKSQVLRRAECWRNAI